MKDFEKIVNEKGQLVISREEAKEMVEKSNNETAKEILDGVIFVEKINRSWTDEDEELHPQIDYEEITEEDANYYSLFETKNGHHIPLPFAPKFRDYYHQLNGDNDESDSIFQSHDSLGVKRELSEEEMYLRLALYAIGY